MIWRFFLVKEFRKYPFFFILIIFTLLIGTIGLVGISIVSKEIKNQLSGRAKELLTSDFSVSARRKISDVEKEIILNVMKDHWIQRYSITDIYSMISFNKNQWSRLVEIRGVEKDFPFYGKLNTKQFKNFNPDTDVYASKELVQLWGLRAGDELNLGNLALKVRDEISDDSSVGLRGVSLAPRLYIPLDLLNQTGLTKTGSVGTYSLHFKLKPESLSQTAILRTKIYEKIQDPAIKVVLPENTSEQTGRAMEIISNFMSLSALIGFILSLIGVFYLYQSHLFSRLKDFSLLLLHGFKKEQVFLGILIQLGAVFGIIFFLEFILLNIAFHYFRFELESFLGFKLGQHLNFFHSLEQVFFLLILSLTALLPLFLGLFRSSIMSLLKSQKLSIGLYKFWEFIPFILSFWIYSWYLSNSFKIGTVFSFLLIVVFFISFFAIQILQKFIKNIFFNKPITFFNLEIGLSLRNLARSGQNLSLSSVALILGATLITFILQLDSLIQKELTLNQKRPGLFIFDIQEEQIDSFIQFSKDFGSPIEAITPMVRGRILKVNGREFKKPKSNLNMRKSFEDDVENRSRNSSVNLTFRNYLTPSEKIIQGKDFHFSKTTEEFAPISIEKRWSERMGIELGDKILFDIQGVEIAGAVVNIKEIKWTDFYPNFFITVAPGYIDEAPKTYLAILPSGNNQNKITFQKSSLSKFPNISFIDVEEAIAKLSQIFEKSKIAISSITWLSLIVGLIILYALSYDQILRRYYEIALFKALGFSSTRTRVQIFLEFGLLFLFSIFIGFMFGWLMAQLIGIEIFKLKLDFDIKSLVISFVLLAFLCTVTIFVSSSKAIRAEAKDLLSDG